VIDALVTKALVVYLGDTSPNGVNLKFSDKGPSCIKPLWHKHPIMLHIFGDKLV